MDALKSLLREPHALAATIDPPGTVLLRNIRLYKMADWPALLGFRLEDKADLAAPPPAP